MSWDIGLINPKNQCVYNDVDKIEAGGTYELGGSTKTILNVTYNYSGIYQFGLLHGRKAGDTIKELEEAVKRLGTEQDNDYWKPTEGNTGFACSILLGWAKLHPEGIWQVY